MNLIGYHIIGSSNIIIKESDLNWNYMYGMHITMSNMVWVEGCNIEWNDFGTYVTWSNNVTIEGCSSFENDDHGVRFDSSNYCCVFNSTFERNDDGVNLELGSHHNNISFNRMKDCRESAIAIGDVENNFFHGNIMTNCSFYFPLEPLTVRYQEIARSNKVGGMDVLYIHNTVINGYQPHDMHGIGQIIIVSSSGLILSNMTME